MTNKNLVYYKQLESNSWIAYFNFQEDTIAVHLTSPSFEEAAIDLILLQMQGNAVTCEVPDDIEYQELTKQAHTLLFNPKKSSIVGRVRVYDESGNEFFADKNDPRLSTGELRRVTEVHYENKQKRKELRMKKRSEWFAKLMENRKKRKDKQLQPKKPKVLVIDKDGKKLRVAVDDVRIETGELTLYVKPIVEEKERPKKEKVKRDKPKKDAKERKRMTKGMSVYKDMDGKTVFAHKNDEKVVSGELVAVCKGLVYATLDGKLLRVKKDDVRFATGELQPYIKKQLKSGMKRGETLLGRMHINKDGKGKRIFESELDDYLAQGWQKGSPLKGKSFKKKE